MVTGISDTTVTRGFGRIGLPNIVPFTYRDGMTVVDILYGLRDYMTQVLHPSLMENINAVVEDLNKELERMDNTILDNKEALDHTYAIFLEEIERRVAIINNRVGPENMKRITLTSDYTLNVDPIWPTAHPILFQVKQTATGGKNLVLGSGIVGKVELDRAAHGVTEFYLVPDGAGKWVVSQSVTTLADFDARALSLVSPVLTQLQNTVNGQLATMTNTVETVKESVEDNGWLAATFLANGPSGEVLSLFYSPDGKTLYGGADNPAYVPTDGQGVRDPSLLRKNNRWYVVHTSNNGMDKDIAIAQSDNGHSGSWSLTAKISGASIATMNRMWAPEFVEDGNDVYIFFSSVTAGDKGSMYWVRATNSALTAWTAPTAVNMPNAPEHYIDGVPVKNNDGKWYMFYSTGGAIERAVSNSVTGQWTVDRTGNWAGWGTGIEGPSIVRDGNIFRAYFDRFVAGTGVHWSEATDLNASWSTPVKVFTAPYATKPGESIRHGSFYKLSSPAARNEIMSSMSMPRTGGNHKELISENVSVSNKTAKYISTVRTDTIETVANDLATWNDANDTITLNRNCIYSISVNASISGVTGVDRTFVEIMGSDGVTRHMRQSGGAEDTWGMSLGNFKPRAAGEVIKIRVYASWAGSQTVGSVTSRIRITEVASI